ncbi:hypothetical protein D7044_30085 [Micromonospora musae]|uniref:DUF6311 domain-containing protein n=1 Tax=Micromonospora musae TaxID=1894970 RepID=A0A3A9XM58_9ACTN|nr:hypothetical protein D7044_30085 [Micromonospora musae]
MGRAGADQPRTLISTGTTASTPASMQARRPHRPLWTADALVVVGYLGLAVLLTGGQWGRPERLFHQAGDQILFEWMLAHAARSVVTGQNPLHSTALNAPDGINLMANTSVLGLGLPLTPVTLLFGSQAAFLTAVVCCLAGTATAWYVLLRRRLVTSRTAAVVGGLFCGFAPGMVSQAGAHLHIAAQFLVPVILAWLFRPEPDRVIWPGVWLGLLVTWQAFIGEETLAFLALAVAVFAVGYALADPAAARRAAPALLGRAGVGAVVAGLLLAYPLWFQFAGPQHYRGMAFDTYSYQLDAVSFIAAARQTVVGGEHPPGLLAPNPTEESSFFGAGLLVLGTVIVIWLGRRPLVRALAGCGLLFALLSLGAEIRVHGTGTGIPGPYRLVAGLPLLELAVPARFALICVPVLGVLLALSLDRARPPRTAPTDAPAGPGVPVRLLWTGAVAAALLPLFPTPIRTVAAPAVPVFLTEQRWRGQVPAGTTVVPVPPVTGAAVSPGMLWSARTGLAFRAPGGYFIGPSGPDDPAARWGAPDRPTAALLRRAAETGQTPVVTDADRRQAVEDLRHWRAAIVVQGELRHGEAVRRTVEALLGPGRSFDGAWVWDVRDRLR